MKLKRLTGILVAFALVLGVFSPCAQAAQRTTLEYEKEVYKFIQDNVLPEHAMGVDYREMSKAEIDELGQLVESAIEGCNTNREKAFAIYNFIAKSVQYNYERNGYLHCAQRDCPVNEITNTSGTSALMAYHVYKSGLGVCEDYANLSSVMMKMADIPTILIVDMDGAHAFNAFYDGDKWVFFDTTWANEKKPEQHFDMTSEYMHSVGSHRLHSLQSLDKDGVLYDVWFSEERYCYISGSISGTKKISVSPGLYGIDFEADYLVSPVHSDVETVVLEEGMTEIPENYFKGCTKLSKITLPSTLKKIGSYAFENCTSLKELIIPDSVTTLGSGIIEYSGVEYLEVGSSVSDCPGTSFLNSENLKKVVISEGVKEICYGMFMYCKAIKELHLPSTLQKIGSSAFYGMDPIEKIYYNGTKEDWKKVYGNILNAGLSSANMIFLQEPEEPEEEEITPPVTQEPSYPVVKEEPKKEEIKEDKEDKKETQKEKEKEDKKESKKSLKNLKKRYSYKGNFKDVATSLWYADYVKKAYEMGIINGSSASTFSPDDTLTVTAVIKMASIINYYYNGGTDEDYFAPKGNQKWYEPYVDYAKKTFYKDISIKDESASAERMYVADVFYRCLPAGEYPSARYVEAIPDVNRNNKYYKSIFALYEAGVLTGSDSKGTFAPNSYIKRSEMAAILARVVDASLRSNEDLGKKPSTGITDAVWYVPETTEADSSLYDESNWIKITKIEYEEPIGDYSHEIKSLKCYDRKEKETIRGDYVAIRCEIKMTPAVKGSDSLSSGGVIVLGDGTKTYEYYYKTSIKDGYYELHLPANMKKGDYEYDSLLGVNGGLTKAKIYFTVK